MRNWLLLICTFVLLIEQSEAQQLPNILWIVSEDNSPYLGCYGDSLATTPNIDQFAKEGHLYTHAYANAPVCAPARNTIITGVYANSNGNQHMRSNYPLSDSVRFFPEYLRAQGYYCTNRSKKDYNTSTEDHFWNESSLKAHYKNRDEGQPFFHVVNTSISHESSLHRFTPDSLLKHRPEKMVLPPYHPDTKEIRHDWAQYYDRITLMDQQVGELLQELKESGEAENTIVFYFSDHGGVLARSKRFVYETGTRVPFIVRIPEKFKNVRPSVVGTPVNRLISFVDLAPTILSLTGQTIPGYMQGRAFLGQKKTKEPEYVHMFRDRMDERYDMSRATRSVRYRYIRNYYPYKIYGQHLFYLWKALNITSWQKACKRGECTEVQQVFWQTKPSEELYDTENDPWEINNLADDSNYLDVLSEMRAANLQWISEIKDTGFIPEQLLADHAEGSGSFYQHMRSGQVDVDSIIQVASMATDEAVSKGRIIPMLDSSDPVYRYWALVGLRFRYMDLTSDDLLYIENKLANEAPDNMAIASELLYLAGKQQPALQYMEEVLKRTDRPFARTRVLNVISNLNIEDQTLKEVVSETYNETYEENRFRYDLTASKALMSQWNNTVR